MRTVICHFYNEEYLLPFWLKHHRALFDHGLMINHRSDDNSVNIIKELTPHWLIVDTKLKWFAGEENDKEVMEYERTILDWKMVLNVTEFLLPAVPMDEIQNYLIKNRLNIGKAKGYSIADNDSTNQPKLEESLPLQKHYGCKDFRGERDRIFHKKEYCNYYYGRHGSRDRQEKFIPNLFLFHYEYSPWNEAIIKRKTQIAPRVPQSDLKRGFGLRHCYSIEKLNEELEDMLKKSEDLSDDPEIKLALDFIKSYY